MINISNHAIGMAPAWFGRQLGAAGDDLLNVFGRWIRRSRTRRALGELDNRQLADIGLDRIGAMGEALKPFWRE